MLKLVGLLPSASIIVGWVVLVHDWSLFHVADHPLSNRKPGPGTLEISYDLLTYMKPGNCDKINNVNISKPTSFLHIRKKYINIFKNRKSILKIYNFLRPLPNSVLNISILCQQKINLTRMTAPSNK
jgi:hypothetical protein